MTRKTSVEIMQRVVNLSKHPLFAEQKELPAWNEAISDLKQLVDDLEANGVVIQPVIKSQHSGAA